MKRIDDREGLPETHLNAEQSPRSESRQAAVMMVDAIMEELSDMDIDLESVTLDEMKQLFADACREK